MRFLAVAVLILTTGLQACTSMRPGYETPSVTISSFQAVPSEGAMPGFEIGLHVINPNREPLELVGIAYTISLEGRELVKGVGKDLPVIEGYSEGDFTVTASASLFEGLRLITDLMGGPRDSLKYDLKTKLDLGSFQPAIRVEDSGEISLAPSHGN